MMQLVHRAATLLPVIAAVVLLPTCGQGGDSPPGRPPAVVSFLDTDSDGIGDLAAIQHLSQSTVLRKAFAEHRRAMLAGVFSALPEPRRAAVEMFLAAMADEGISPNDIHGRLGQALEQAGLALPDGWYDSPEEFTERCLMSSAQHAEIAALVRSLKATGTAYADVRLAVLAKYREWSAVGRPLLPGVPVTPQAPSDTGCLPCGSAPSNQMYEGEK